MVSGSFFHDFGITFDLIFATFSDHCCVWICIPRKRDFGDPYKGNQWFCLLECGPKYDIIESKTKSKNSVKKKHQNDEKRLAKGGQK